MRQTNWTGKPIDQVAVAGKFGDGAEWYLTVRCASSNCGQLIAFQKAIYAGDQPNLRFAITGEPTVRCPLSALREFLRLRTSLPVVQSKMSGANTRSRSASERLPHSAIAIGRKKVPVGIGG